MGLINDASLNAAKVALNGLAMRQQMLSRNVANVDTPGYHAQTVDFESAVRQVLNKTEKAPELTLTSTGHIQPEADAITGFIRADRVGGSERVDGNNVDIDSEMIDMTDTNVRYQAITQLVNKKFQLIKAIAASR
jgi:flagellar basal-body rod protein FlgB